ncbi:hypothetical protein TNCV_2603771 [Trichonephila clavipes]|nr:hypothetical protein TNCV_2603771 [Trichonephila clavipes]
MEWRWVVFLDKSRLCLSNDKRRYEYGTDVLTGYIWPHLWRATKQEKAERWLRILAVAIASHLWFVLRAQ